MPPFLYRCPNTGYRVQGFVAEDVSEDSERYETMTCIACQRIHLVNPASGKVLGAEEEQEGREGDQRGAAMNVS